MEGWLEEIGISVNNYEEELCNGYVIGSILYRYDLQPDFASFGNKEKFISGNLEKLKSSLNGLGIKLDTEKLRNKTERYAAGILSKIFMKIHNNTTATTRLAANTTQKQSKKTEAVTNKFEVEYQKLLEKVQKGREKDVAEYMQNVQNARTAKIETLRSNKQFMKEWETKGWQDWQENQAKFTTMKEAEYNLKVKLAQDYKNKQLREIAYHEEDAKKGIEEFEMNMMRLGIDHNSDENSVKKKVQNLETEAAVIMAKIKENKARNEEAAKEREARQRKLEAQQIKNKRNNKLKEASGTIASHLENLINLRALYAFVLIKKVAKKKKTHEESLKKYHQITAQNQQKLLELESARMESTAELEKKRRLEMPIIVYNIRMKLISDLRQKHEKNAERLAPILDTLIELTELSNDYISKNSKIPGTQWDEWLNRFVQGEALVKGRTIGVAKGNI
jgi:hypothetical protein